MEFLFGLLLRFPAVFQSLGLGLATASVGAIGVGLRVGRGLGRVERATGRAGTPIQTQLDQVLPWWLNPFVPETGWGFVTWATLGILGLVLAATAKKIRKVYRSGM
jgi:hypothetical protein